MNLKTILFLCVIGLVWSCNDATDNVFLTVSQNLFSIESGDVTLEVDISSNGEWEVVSSAPQWCIPGSAVGKNNATLQLKITANINKLDRAATVYVRVRSGAEIQEIKIAQKGIANLNPDTYCYRIPVIFHVLYQDKNDNNQHPAADRFKEIIEQCNRIYQSKVNPNSTDMNLEFVLATQSPNGETLPHAGVEYIQRGTSKMDHRKFMSEENKDNVGLLWDLDEYINVMVYEFTNENVLGVSHLPFSMKSSYLEGLTEVKYLVKTSNLVYPHCVSINSSYIHEQSTEDMYNSLDVSVSLAHELGHYLGLYHVFSEDENGEANQCLDSDYCDDTPMYNRIEYDQWLEKYFAETSLPLLSDVVKRKACDGSTFVSHNILDYAYSYSDLFSSDQKRRVRHVLANSPLIPGPKKETRTRTVTLQGIQDLPIRVME